jgi:hypothetical protein
MRTLFLSRVVLTAALLWGGAALAKREVKEFEAPREMSQEELEAAKAQARNGNIHAYGKDVQIKPEPVPWMAIGLGGIVFAIAIPFGISVYRNTAKEMATANTFGGSGKRNRDADEE